MVKSDAKGSIDYLIMIMVALISVIGIVMVFSAGSAISTNSMYYLQSHLIKIILSVILLIVFSKIDYHLYQGKSFYFVLISFAFLFILIAAKVLGLPLAVRNTYRWINLGFINLQPSEMYKIAIIIFLADSLSRKQATIRSFSQVYCPHLVIIGMGFLLILAEPDFGTATAVMVVGFLIMFMAGIPKRYVISTLLMVLPFLYWAVRFSAYRWARIMGFLHPEMNTDGINYQINQSLISIGKGGIFGEGFGQSTQKMFYLPEAHTDFVFSIYSEETGLIGSLILITLFLVILFRGYKIARSSQDLFGFLLAGGIVSMVVLYAVLNISVVSALLPTKGLTLPFVSFGGSAMMFNMIGIGILLNITRHILPASYKEKLNEFGHQKA